MIGMKMENYADMMFQGPVADLQRAEGSYDKFQSFYVHRTQPELSDQDIAFIRARDSFYISSLNAQGWPYIQHRGGARGFVHILDANQLACADYVGNRQFITMGNLAGDDRVSLFFMDYLNHARLKVQGRATLKSVADSDPELVEQLDTGKSPAQRILTVDIISMDWNCPKYIPTLYPEDVIRNVIGQQMGALQAENEMLKAQLAKLRG
jgi:predicted pyridoxine 5'-phosphate oxidase superfamily flavin-nucleotide-binding protein